MGKPEARETMSGTLEGNLQAHVEGWWEDTQETRHNILGILYMLGVVILAISILVWAGWEYTFFHLVMGVVFVAFIKKEDKARGFVDPEWWLSGFLVLIWPLALLLLAIHP